MHEYVLGGGFGGKQDYDEILAAAYCAKEVGRPVKLIQTRETNFATSFPRTPSYHKLKAGLKNGQLVAMNHDICVRLHGPAFRGRQEVHNGTDWLQLDSWPDKKKDVDQWSIGGSDHWYDVENHRVRAWDSDRTTWAVQASALRTVSNSYNMFVVELFIDEVAHALKRDPLEFRLAMLNGKGGNRGIPNTGYPAGHAVGLLHGPALDLAAMDDRQELAARTNRPRWAGRCGSRIACGWRPGRRAGARRSCRPTPAWASPSPRPRSGRARPGSPASPKSRSIRTTGAYRINRITVAIDPGTVVNPRNATAQIQGAALWGASQVMSERLTIRNGAFEQSNFHDYQPIRLADVPRDRRRADLVRPSPERRRRAVIHGGRAGGSQRDLQRGRRARAAHADHARGDPGGPEAKGLTNGANARRDRCSQCAEAPELFAIRAARGLLRPVSPLAARNR